MAGPIRPSVDEMDPSVIAAIVVAIVVVLVTVYLKFFTSASESRDTFMIVGPSGAGKTLLWCQLCHNKRPIDTITSMKAIAGTASDLGEKGSDFPVVDVPGHPRLREVVLGTYAKKTMGLIFVIDACSLTQELSEVAHYMYQVLSDRQLVGCPVLVLCNKQDFTFRATKSTVVRGKLEAEFNLIRKTQAASLTGTDDNTDDSHVVLGIEGTDFKFEHLPVEVEFLDFICKPKTGLADLKPVNSFLKRSLQ